MVRIVYKLHAARFQNLPVRELILFSLRIVGPGVYVYARHYGLLFVVLTEDASA